MEPTLPHRAPVRTLPLRLVSGEFEPSGPSAHAAPPTHPAYPVHPGAQPVHLAARHVSDVNGMGRVIVDGRLVAPGLLPHPPHAGPGPAPTDHEHRITREEHDVLRMLASGLTDQAIARRCGVSTRTVGRWLSRLEEKLDSPSRFVLGAQAARRGLV